MAVFEVLELFYVELRKGSLVQWSDWIASRSDLVPFQDPRFSTRCPAGSFCRIWVFRAMSGARLGFVGLVAIRLRSGKVGGAQYLDSI